jgi:ATP-dependent Clp protease ATP-binding subunit ClpB
LRGLKDRYETHHHVRIKDEAVVLQLNYRIVISPTGFCRISD